MKYLILTSVFNPDNGISIVTINSKYGKFTGRAQLNPDDKHYESKYFGCQIAESRAVIEIYKYKIRNLNEQLRSLYDTFNIMFNSKKTDKKGVEIGIIRKQINARLKEKIKLYTKINAIEMSISKISEQRIKYLKDIESKRKGNNR